MNKTISDEQRFEVMRLFLSAKDNRVDVIAELAGISRISTSKIIERYYKNGGLIIESRMNKLELCDLEEPEPIYENAS